MGIREVKGTERGADPLPLSSTEVATGLELQAYLRLNSVHVEARHGMTITFFTGAKFLYPFVASIVEFNTYFLSNFFARRLLRSIFSAFVLLLCHKHSTSRYTLVQNLLL